ncbi:MAG: hypothetical protein U0V49_08225 [Saprospiraceae bacterium]
MAEISLLAVLISTATYIVVYFFGFNMIVKDHTSGTSNLGAQQLLVVLPLAFLFSFFVALFMLMTERMGMADGIKSGFMLTLSMFCFPAIILYRTQGRDWFYILRVCGFFLLCHTLCGAIIGLISA